MLNPSLIIEQAQDALDYLSRGEAIRFEMESACVQIAGADAKNFLHRMSANEVEALKVGEGGLNVLVNQKGRIVDAVHQLVLSDESVLLVCSPGRAQKVMGWLDQFLFVEKVLLADVSKEYSVAQVIGGEVAPDNAIRSFYFMDGNGQKVGSWVVVNPPAPFFKGGKITKEIFETLRVIGGVPGFPGEFDEGFNPLEVGLEQAISWNKGCYIGQEVISRIKTYQKKSRQLRQLFEVPPDAEVTTLAPQRLLNRPVALTVSSVSESILTKIDAMSAIGIDRDRAKP